MRAYRAVWSPFGAHDQRKRPHKLPDYAVKERLEGENPLSETAHYTHANPSIKRLFGDAPGVAAPPVRWASREVRRDASARAAGTPSGGSRGGEPATRYLAKGVAERLRARLAGAAWPSGRGRCGRNARTGSQSAVAMAVRAVRSSFASNGFALCRKSSI